MKNHHGAIRRYTAMAIMPLLLFSCARPSSDELYVRVSQNEVQHLFSYELEMDDPQYAYDVDIYLSLDDDSRNPEPFSEEVIFLWVSPSGSRYKETISLSSDTQSQKSFFTKTLLYHYRKDLVPVEHGIWRLYLTFPYGFEERSNANGVGVRLIRKPS